MKKMLKNFPCMMLILLMVSACTHQNVNVTEFDDKDKSCAMLKQDILNMETLENDIDDKTGFSGRNVGMALLFWPGVIVNEMNADDALDRASDRKQHLMRLYDNKNCS